MTSELPWPVPAGWRWCKFGDVARVASNLVDPAEFPRFPHVAPNHIEPETGRLLPHGTVSEDAVISANHRFFPGQVLYSKIRPYLAKVVVADFEGLCSADMYPIESELDSRFLKWWMLTREFTRRAAGEQARTVLPKINVRALLGLPVPVPSPAEQRRIVEVLEDHLSRLDAADIDLTGVLLRMVSLREGMVRAELTGGRGGRSRGRAELRGVGVDDGSLPEMPPHWHWKRLQELADVVGGVTKDAKRQSDPMLVEVPYLRVANVQRGRLDLSTVSSIRVPPATAEKLRLLAGDVLLNEGGDRDKLGRGWVWEGQVEPCIHQNHVFRARVRDSQLDPYLLSWAANSFGGRWCERNGRQSVNLASISLSKIKMMPVPVPPRGEQDAVAKRIREVMDASLRLESQAVAARQRGLILRRALLAAAFSGRLT